MGRNLADAALTRFTTPEALCLPTAGAGERKLKKCHILSHSGFRTERSAIFRFSTILLPGLLPPRFRECVKAPSAVFGEPPSKA